MEEINYLVVIDANSERGVVDAHQLEGAEASQISIRLKSGQTVVVPRDLVTRQSDGSYSIPFTFEQVWSTYGNFISPEASASGAFSEARVIPVIAEEIAVGKREVEVGRVRITKTVHEEERQIDEPVLREDVTVERRTVNQYVDEPVSVRYEGDTMIVPLVEEVLVIEKRLLVREELHITKRKVEERHAETVTLRREEAHVERIANDDESLRHDESSRH